MDESGLGKVGGDLVGADGEEGQLGEEGGAAGLGAGRQVRHVEAQVHLLPVQVYVRMEALHNHTSPITKALHQSALALHK